MGGDGIAVLKNLIEEYKQQALAQKKRADSLESTY